MANSPQAKKRARQSEIRRGRNTAQRSMLRSTIKRVVNAIAANDKAAAETAYKDMVPVLDRHSNRGLIHKNKAARHKSRLTQRIQAISASASASAST